MPEHYALGLNIQSGNAIFNNEKEKQIVFNVEFNQKPSVILAQDSMTNFSIFRVNISKYGFTIKSSINYTGEIEWVATKK